MLRASASLLLFLLLSPAVAQDCPLGDPSPKKGPTTPGEDRQSSRPCLTWEEVARVSPVPQTGKKAAGAKAAVRKRPLLVYVFDQKDPERYRLPDTHESWKSWQVVVPGRLFERLRISVEHAKADPALRAHAKRRRLLFLRPDLTLVAGFSPRASVPKLYDAMKRTVALDFTPSVDSVWAKWQRCWKAYWETKEEMAKLNDLVREAARTRDAGKRAELTERHRREMAKHEQRLRELDAEEKTFYALERKVE